MFRFISKSLLNTLQTRPFHVSSIRTLSTQCLSSNSEKRSSAKQHSLTVSYLTNTCGLPLSKAISASTYVQIENTKNPDLVLQLFREHGCTSSELSSLITMYPRLICADAVKTLKPKIEYFESLGLNGYSFFKVLGRKGSLMLMSSNNNIIPAVDFLRVFLRTDEDFVSLLKSRIIVPNVSKMLKPKISILVSCGVPRNGIRILILQHPRCFETKVEVFGEVINKVLQMGIAPRKNKFVWAVGFMAEKYDRWDCKRELLMSFGWSEAEFLSAFIIQPKLLTCSEEKIRVMMEFYLNKIGLKPSDVAKCPNILFVSLYKRVIPRCAVLNVLRAMGLIRKDLEVVWILNTCYKSFENQFITYWKGYSPDVMKAYRGEIGFQGFSN